MLCGRDGGYLWQDPEGVGMATLSVWAVPDSAARRATAAAGVEGLYYADVSGSEL